MNRRGFLKSIGAAAVAWTLARQLPGIVEAAPVVPGPARTVHHLTRGDIFTIEGVKAVNPINHRSTGMLQHFVVTADVSVDDGFREDLPIFPKPVDAGMYRNVVTMPTRGDEVIPMLTGDVMPIDLTWEEMGAVVGA
jgi:hypothetical protein